MSKRTDKDLLKDILEASQRAISYSIEMTYEEFLKDTKTQDAIVRNIEILGEAVKNISDEFRNNHSLIPWKNIAGMRDRLIHNYFGVNWDIVWDVVKKDLPDLINKIETFLPNL